MTDDTDAAVQAWTHAHQAGYGLMQQKLREELDQAYLDYGEDVRDVLEQIGELAGEWRPPNA